MPTADESPRKPDAVKIPVGFRLPPGTQGSRFHAEYDLAEQILGADKTRGEAAHRCTLANESMHLFFLDPASTLKFPHNSHLSGRPRYHWVAQPDGKVFGYLTDEAKAELAALRA